MKSMNRYFYLTGILFPIIAYSSILFAISQAPWFSWYHNALSDLGVHSASSIIFNSGLIISGFIYFIFSIGLINRCRSFLWRIGVILLICDAVSLMLVGVFPENIKFYHGLFAVLYFILFPVSFMFMSISLIKSVDTKFGYILIMSAILGLIPWLIPWKTIGIKGIAIPEILASLANTVPLFLFSIKSLFYHRETNVSNSN